MEIIANAVQEVSAGANIYFTDTVVCGNCSMIHRDDSGLVTLRGLTNSQCRARFLVHYSGNIAIPTGGAVAPISLAIAIEGEAVPSTTMIATPAAVDNYSNVSSSVYVDVPRGCCLNVSVKNTSTAAINVQNSNLIITREA